MQVSGIYNLSSFFLYVSVCIDFVCHVISFFFVSKRFHHFDVYCRLADQLSPCNSSDEGDSEIDSINDDLSSNVSNNSGSKRQKRGILPKQATSVMRAWLFQHLVVSSYKANLIVRRFISSIHSFDDLKPLCILFPTCFFFIFYAFLWP